MMVEVLNTGIEAACDAISREFHIDIQLAKDCGSLAVLISVILVAGVWGSRWPSASSARRSERSSAQIGPGAAPSRSRNPSPAAGGSALPARQISARGMAGARQHPRPRLDVAGTPRHVPRAGRAARRRDRRTSRGQDHAGRVRPLLRAAAALLPRPARRATTRSRTSIISRSSPRPKAGWRAASTFSTATIM